MLSHGPPTFSCVTDNLQRKICWHEKNYIEHLSYRPELSHLLSDIKNTIKRPHKRTLQKNRIEIFYSDTLRFDKKGNRLVIKVVVQFVTRNEGYVKTAHLVRQDF